MISVLDYQISVIKNVRCEIGLSKYRIFNIKQRVTICFYILSLRKLYFQFLLLFNAKVIRIKNLPLLVIDGGKFDLRFSFTNAEWSSLEENCEARRTTATNCCRLTNDWRRPPGDLQWNSSKSWDWNECNSNNSSYTFKCKKLDNHIVLQKIKKIK